MTFIESNIKTIHAEIEKMTIIDSHEHYVREAILLGKTRGNVWMNMCFTYIISPHFACNALTEMLEMVPWNKIIGFGGDYTVVEKVYGHLVLARQVIAKALAIKVCDGSMTIEKAVSLAHHMLYQNPKNLYKLGNR